MLSADEDDDGEPDNAPAKAAVTPAPLTPATGFCVDTTDTLPPNLHEEVDRNEDSDLTDPGDLVALTTLNAIIFAFHWDMLSGDEMAVAARSAGVGSSAINDYKKNFGQLTHAQKLNVISWFSDSDGGSILTRGEGALTAELNLVIDHRGINDVDTDGVTDGKVGSATITVKASDADGRLIPPPNGSGTVGKSFTVTAKLSDAEPLQEFGPAVETNINVQPGEGNLVTRVNFPGETVTDDENVAKIDMVDEGQRYEIRVSPNAEDIGSVALGTGYDFDPHNQAITFSLTNGGNVAFQVAQPPRGTSAKIQTIVGS